MAIDFARARDIFLAAVGNHGGNRQAAYLDEACGADGELRRHVDLLLSAHGQSGCFLDQGAVAFPGIDQRLSERPGTQIGSYKLLQQIGAGGFGVVFLAEQTAPVLRRVALKVIKPGMDTREVVARFEGERQGTLSFDFSRRGAETQRELAEQMPSSATLRSNTNDRELPASSA